MRVSTRAYHAENRAFPACTPRRRVTTLDAFRRSSPSVSPVPPDPRCGLLDATSAPNDLRCQNLEVIRVRAGPCQSLWKWPCSVEISHHANSRRQRRPNAFVRTYAIGREERVDKYFQILPPERRFTRLLHLTRLRIGRGVDLNLRARSEAAPSRLNTGSSVDPPHSITPVRKSMICARILCKAPLCS